MKPCSVLTQIASLLSSPLTKSDKSQEKNSESPINQEVLEARGERKEWERSEGRTGKRREEEKEGEREQACVFYAFTKHHLGAFRNLGSLHSLFSKYVWR